MAKLSIVKTKAQLCLDMETSCKNQKTAYRRFYKAIEQAQKDGAFGSYDLLSDVLVNPDDVDWQYNTPICGSMEDTGYCIGMECPDDDTWYLWANVTYKRMEGDFEW